MKAVIQQQAVNIAWKERKNRILSAVMEQDISNFQGLLIWQAVASFVLLTCSIFTLPGLILAGSWFTLSILLCKKYIDIN